MKIGIFGGSFNPPHKMHTDIAEYLLNNKYLDKVIFVPTGDKYSYKNNLTDACHRLKMLELATKLNHSIEVSDYELKSKVVYTCETLEYFKKKYLGCEIYFICGTDNLSYIDEWKNGLQILNDYKILVIKRETDDIDELLEKYKNYSKNIIQVDIKMNPLSSTSIRNKIKNNEVLTDREIDKEVLNYIKKEKLYIERNINMFKNVVDKLKVLHKTIATMESCTGGRVASEITDCPGASEILKFSAVTYSNEYKTKMGVDPKVIDEFTVYSIETAREMAYNISKYAGSDYGIGITGKINSPDPANPAGEDDLIFVAIYDKEKDIYHEYTYTAIKNVERTENKKYIAENIQKELENIL